MIYNPIMEADEAIKMKFDVSFLTLDLIKVTTTRRSMVAPP
jgi:hypothetical protein